MGITKTLFLEADENDGNWETYYRRTYARNDWLDYLDSEVIRATTDDQEDLGNDVARRERLAQAIYEV